MHKNFLLAGAMNRVVQERKIIKNSALPVNVNGRSIINNRTPFISIVHCMALWQLVSNSTPLFSVTDPSTYTYMYVLAYTQSQSTYYACKVVAESDFKLELFCAVQTFRWRWQCNDHSATAVKTSFHKQPRNHGEMHRSS